MDSQTKLLTSRASLELHYGNGKSTLTAYREVDSTIDGLYQQGNITRQEMNKLKQVNEELYLEFSGG
jgi:cell division protein FtsB